MFLLCLNNIQQVGNNAQRALIGLATAKLIALANGRRLIVLWRKGNVRVVEMDGQTS